MLIDSSVLQYDSFTDPRNAGKSDSEEYGSGPLLMAKDNTSGQRYIVKYTYPYQPANEAAACWLADQLNIPAPHAYLLKPNRKLPALYAVAISYIDGLTAIEYPLNQFQKNEMISQYIFNAMIKNTDKTQMQQADGHIYSYDFSESFCIADQYPLMTYLSSRGENNSLLQTCFQVYLDYLKTLNIPYASIAALCQCGINEVKQQESIIIKRLLNISKEDIAAVCSDISEIYFPEYADYYRKCLAALQFYLPKL